MEAEGFTGYATICSKAIIGLYFFNGTVSDESYLQMLKDYFYRVFCNLSGNQLIVFLQEPIFCD
jgi:hypothetical protein